jgi:hypothetical protein
MYKWLFKVSLFSLYTTISLETGSTIAAPVARLEDLRFDPNASQLEITLSAASQPRYFYLAQPPRIVVDLPGIKLGYDPIKQNYNGAIQSIRVSQFSEDVTRIVMDLAPRTFVDPNQVQIQPISWQNPTRWVIRPLLNNNRTFSPPTNFPSPNNFPPRDYNSPPPPADFPPRDYNSPPPPADFPPRDYNSPPPPADFPPRDYNSPPPPADFPPEGYNSPPPPSNLPPAFNNNQLPPSFNFPPPITNPPPTTSSNQQPPFVRVPPLTPNNPTPLPNSILPPAKFPNLPGNFNNSAPSMVPPNFSVPIIPNSPNRVPNSEVIPFGQPFPRPRF